LRIDRLTLGAGELALAVNDAQAFGLVDVDITLADFDASDNADDITPGRLELEASTAAGASIELDAALQGFERASGRLSVRGHALAALPAWLANAPLAEFRATLELDGAYVLTEPLAAARLQIDEARVELADFTAATRSVHGARAAQLAGTGSVVLVATADGTAAGTVRLALAAARVEITDGGAAPPQTFAVTGASVSASLGSVADDFSLDLGGRLADAGEVSVQIVAAGADDMSVSLTARDLPATKVSPYAVAAIGHRLAAGTFDVALDYRQSAGRVAGDLRIAAANAALDAGALPPGPGAYALDLAVALLADTNGVAELATPFTGAGEDVRTAIAAAVDARIASLAAAPFEPLAAIVERPAQALMSVSFVPGDTELGEQAQATVDSLAAALAQRPRLGLRVHGAVDPTADRLALARRQIELHVTLATAGAAPQARPEPVDFASPRAQDILDEFAGERLAPERVLVITRAFNCGPDPTPACRAVYYEAIFDALADNESIPASTLMRLGRFRAQAVAEAFEERGIAARRIAVVMGATETSADVGGVGVPLELFPRSAR
jgi:outer membrane protein OmpA-like peptidoglycan-associated protein